MHGPFLAPNHSLFGCADTFWLRIVPFLHVLTLSGLNCLIFVCANPFWPPIFGCMDSILSLPALFLDMPTSSCAEFFHFWMCRPFLAMMCSIFGCGDLPPCFCIYGPHFLHILYLNAWPFQFLYLIH